MRNLKTTAPLALLSGLVFMLGACASESGASASAAADTSMSSPAPMPMAEAMPMEKTVMVGGAAMYPSKNIVENAMNSSDHTTLVAAVKAAGLVDTLSSPGPFTVFAPTNAAFDKLPKGTVDKLLMPANKATLQKILTYHVVAGKMSAADIVAAIKAGGGKAVLTTVEGEKLTASLSGDMVALKDAKGGMSTVTIADVNQSNGVIHVVDTVLMPAK